MALDNLVQVVRATVPQDPGAATEEAQHGRIAFDYGTAFTKGIIGSGQCACEGVQSGAARSRRGPGRL